MKIDLPLVTGLPWHVPVVSAELVDVAPHINGATFAVHRCIESMHKGKWQVTHIETGFVGGPRCPTKERAVKMARKFYADMKQSTFDAAVAKALAAAPWIEDPTYAALFDALPAEDFLAPEVVA